MTTISLQPSTPRAPEPGHSSCPPTRSSSHVAIASLRWPSTIRCRPCTSSASLSQPAVLVSYGSNLGNAYHHIGVYAGKILKGLNPAEMPMVQQSDKLELVINLKTAKALSIQVPATLQTSADEVIE